MELVERLPDVKPVRPRLAALQRATRRRTFDQPTALRLRLLSEYRDQIANLDSEEKTITRELRALVQASGSTLEQLYGLSTIPVAELLVEVGDPAGSPRAGSHGSTPQRRSWPRPARGRANRSGTAITPAATGG